MNEVNERPRIVILMEDFTVEPHFRDQVSYPKGTILYAADRDRNQYSDVPNPEINSECVIWDWIKDIHKVYEPGRS